MDEKNTAHELPVMPEPGSIWVLRKSGNRYRVESNGKQKEGDGQWYPSVFYRSVPDDDQYSRRLTSFLEEFDREQLDVSFLMLRNHDLPICSPVSFSAQAFRPGDRVRSTLRWGDGTVLGPTSAEGRYRVRYDRHPGVFAALPSQLQLLERP